MSTIRPAPDGIQGVIDRKRAPAAARPAPYMWITPGRVMYVGLLGRPSVRRYGGWALYFSLDAPLRISLDTAETADAALTWAEGELALVPPYTPYRVACDGPYLPNLLIEPETIAPDALVSRFGALTAHGGVANLRDAGVAELLARLRAACETLRPRVHELPADDIAFDEAVLGSALAPAGLDPRVARALQQLDRDLDATGEDLAAQAGLSFSRFLHLFRDEVGSSLRVLRSWKRARRALSFVTQNTNLTAIAQELGYPDAAHFSRSIRQVFGLQPRDVMAGSRRLMLRASRPGEPGG